MTQLEAYNGVTNIINQIFNDKLNEFKHNLEIEAIKNFELNNDISNLKEGLNDGENWSAFLFPHLDNYINDKLYNAE